MGVAKMAQLLAWVWNVFLVNDALLKSHAADMAEYPGFPPTGRSCPHPQKDQQAARARH